MAKVIDFEEVKKHNHRTDCWVIISDKVYDVTQFLDDHPGGDEVILNVTGKDATEDFDVVGHSKSAIDMLQQYYVGDVDSSTFSTNENYNPPTWVDNKSGDTGFGTKILQMLIPLLILSIGLAFRYFVNKKED